MSNTTTTIKVDTAMISTSATKLDGFISSYEESYKAVMRYAKELESTWDGTDNDKFNEQLEGFHGDFVDLHDKLNDYVTFLKEAAKAYDAAQDKLVTDAGNLATNR